MLPPTPPLSFLSCRLAALLSCSLLDPCKSLHSLSGLTATAPGRGTRCGASCFSVAGLTRKAPHNTRQDTSPRRFVYPSSWFRLLAWLKRMSTGLAGSRDRLFRCGLSLAGRAAGGDARAQKRTIPFRTTVSMGWLTPPMRMRACACVTRHFFLAPSLTLSATDTHAGPSPGWVGGAHHRQRPALLRLPPHQDDTGWCLCVF